MRTCFMANELNQFFEMVRSLETADLYQLFIQETDPEKQAFYKAMYDYSMQAHQREVIARPDFVR